MIGEVLRDGLINIVITSVRDQGFDSVDLRTMIDHLLSRGIDAFLYYSLRVRGKTTVGQKVGFIGPGRPKKETRREK